MKSYHTLAWKELLAQKVTSGLILIAMILSTMMTTVIGQSVGILSAMRKQQAIAIAGNRYATFVQMDGEQAETLQKDSRLSYVGLSVSIGSVELNSALTLGLTEYLGDSLENYPSLSKIREGRLPKRAMEIALPQDVLQFLGFEGRIGDTVTIPVSKALRHGIETTEYNYTAEFTLTGITESNYLGYAAGSVCGIVGEGTAETVLPDSYIYYMVDIRTAEKRTFQATMDDLAETLQVHELDTMYNTTYLDALGIPYDKKFVDTDSSDDGFSFMLLAGILVGALILLAAGLVIYNILKIAVSRRMKQYGVLRAMGAERGQLYFLVVAEVLLLCILGIPAGMLLGLLSAKGILTAATGLLSPGIFMVRDAAELTHLIAENSSGKGGFLLFSAAVTLIFAFLAAVPAARAASGVSPVIAMSGTNTKIKRKGRSKKRIWNFEAYYARLNLKRNRGRTVITVLSLVMSISVFITLQGAIGLLNAAGRSESEHLGDYSIINEITGFSPKDLLTLEENENVAAVAAMQFSLYMQDEQKKLEGISLDFDLQPGETFQVLGLNDVYWEDFFGELLSSEQLEEVKTGNGCVVRNPIPLVFEGEEIPRTEIRTGSTITVAEKELFVQETLNGYDGYLSVGNSGFTNGVQVIVNNSLYSELTGIDSYAELCPVLREGTDRAVFDDMLDALCQKIPGTTCISYEQTDRQLQESFAQIQFLAWGLILFVGLIGILNIINTVYTNIHTRVTEIGTQRAIGMSAGSLYRTFLWEGAYYGLIAAVVGSVVGYICTIFVNAATGNEIRLVSIPVVPMAAAAFLSLAACLLATCIPLRRMRKMSIVDSMETVE